MAQNAEAGNAENMARSERALNWRALWQKVRFGHFLLAVALFAVFRVSERYAHLMRFNVSDDAMTSMQYAKNLVLGHGLVFNVGERVDGYTNFLWVLFMAPLYALSLAFSFDFVRALTHVDILIAVLVVGVTYLVGNKLWGRNLAVWVAVSFCVVDNSFTTWAVLGLEVEFLAFWMLLALLLWRSELKRRALWTGLALAAAHLTRPDAGLFCACVVGSELFAKRF